MKKFIIIILSITTFTSGFYAMSKHNEVLNIKNYAKCDLEYNHCVDASESLDCENLFDSCMNFEITAEQFENLIYEN